MQLNAGIAIDGTVYDYVDIEYILKNTNGRRKGTLSISIDALLKLQAP